MKLFITTIFFILFSFFSQAQFEMRINPYLKGEIVLKNDSVETGYIKLDDSAFKVKFKGHKEQKSEKKISPDNISKIIIYTASANREFLYKKTDASKFPKFVELIYAGKFDLYLFSINNLSLFYKDVDRSNVTDFIFLDSNYSIEKIKENLKKVISPEYLLDMKNSEELNFIYSNKNLRKKANQYFRGCSSLISRIENKEWKLENIIDIVDFYNNCEINEQ